MNALVLSYIRYQLWSCPVILVYFYLIIKRTKYFSLFSQLFWFLLICRLFLHLFCFLLVCCLFSQLFCFLLVCCLFSDILFSLDMSTLEWAATAQTNEWQNQCDLPLEKRKWPLEWTKRLHNLFKSSVDFVCIKWPIQSVLVFLWWRLFVSFMLRSAVKRENRRC